MFAFKSLVPVLVELFLYVPVLVVVDAESGGAAEERVVHEDVGGKVVGVRVPQAARTHPYALAPLLADHHLDHDLWQQLQILIDQMG